MSNGALVNRNGATVATATIETVDLYDNMIAQTLHVGAVLVLPIEGGSMECAVEKTWSKSSDDRTFAVVFCADALVFADSAKKELAFRIISEGSMLEQVLTEEKIPVVESRKLSNPAAAGVAAAVTVGCLVVGMANGAYGAVDALASYGRGEIGFWGLMEALVEAFTGIPMSVTPIGCAMQVWNAIMNVSAAVKKQKK